MSHATIVAEIKRMGKYSLGERFHIPGYFGYLWVKERWWSCRDGCVLYRVADLFDESRMRTVKREEELRGHEVPLTTNASP
ncbi:MAG TPA: hypothetical protein VKG92_03105 [Flavobacteriales bacterium]|nr:hypothetical protein [Flavobacteriales bacterium]